MTNAQLAFLCSCLPVLLVVLVLKRADPSLPEQGFIFDAMRSVARCGARRESRSIIRASLPMTTR